MARYNIKPAAPQHLSADQVREWISVSDDTYRGARDEIVRAQILPPGVRFPGEPGVPKTTAAGFFDDGRDYRITRSTGHDDRWTVYVGTSRLDAALRNLKKVESEPSTPQQFREKLKSDLRSFAQRAIVDAARVSDMACNGGYVIEPQWVESHFVPALHGSLESVDQLQPRFNPKVRAAKLREARAEVARFSGGDFTKFMDRVTSHSVES